MVEFLRIQYALRSVTEAQVYSLVTVEKITQDEFTYIIER
jgi:hypothetical protein